MNKSLELKEHELDWYEVDADDDSACDYDATLPNAPIRLCKADDGGWVAWYQDTIDGSIEIRGDGDSITEALDQMNEQLLGLQKRIAAVMEAIKLGLTQWEGAE